MRTMYQLWCYYDTRSEWVMESFYNTKEEAQQEIQELRDNVNTPCMSDWYIVKVECFG